MAAESSFIIGLDHDEWTGFMFEPPHASVPDVLLSRRECCYLATELMPRSGHVVQVCDGLESL
ncbi:MULTISPECIES: hypothetical protein [unclassified Streptomyces]|uniref:hypothetical protein n=1 Tax=unclassified Streptomyces TaxID=2593676 RepID=UPI0036E0AB32